MRASPCECCWRRGEVTPVILHTSDLPPQADPRPVSTQQTRVHAANLRPHGRPRSAQRTRVHVRRSLPASQTRKLGFQTHRLTQVTAAPPPLPRGCPSAPGARPSAAGTPLGMSEKGPGMSQLPSPEVRTRRRASSSGAGGQGPPVGSGGGGASSFSVITSSTGLESTPVRKHSPLVKDLHGLLE